VNTSNGCRAYDTIFGQTIGLPINRDESMRILGSNSASQSRPPGFAIEVHCKPLAGCWLTLTRHVLRLKQTGVAMVFSAAIVSSSSFAASRITTTNGDTLVGEIERLQDGTYSVRTPYGTVTIPARAVRQIEPMAGGGADNSGETRPRTGTLRFAGSNTIGAALVPELVKHYVKAGGARDLREERGGDEDWSLRAATGVGEFRADVASHGSATAISALVSGQADVGMMSRPIKTEEVTALAAIGFGEATAPGQEHVLALDGIVVLVNKANPVTELSLADIAGIFSGAVTDWSQFGGQPRPIRVLARDDKSGTFDTFKTLVLRDRKLASSAQRYESSEELSDEIANNPNTIGFTGIAYVRNARAIAIRSDCGLSFAATSFAVKTEEYPLSRRLFLYTGQRLTNPLVGDFVEYALSEAAQAVGEEKGFVSLRPEFSPAGYTATRIALAAHDQESDAKVFAAFAKGVVNGLRLSITYRFRPGESRLDTRAVRDVDRLAEFLNRNDNRGRRIVLAGFSDSRGTPARNMQLSAQRAATVARELRQRNVNPAQVVGYGPVAPVACNTNAEGLEKNRRVEVWLF
jgi:phosphate transport system substrate-binding protein